MGQPLIMMGCDYASYEERKKGPCESAEAFPVWLEDFDADE